MNSAMDTSAERPSPLMVEVRANGTDIPICFLVDAARLANISSLHLSVRFNFVQSSLWVERKVFHPMTSMLTYTMLEFSIRSGNSFCAWNLLPGKYRVYGLSESQFAASTELRTPRRSSLCTMTAPCPVGVKVELANVDVIELSESSDSGVPTQRPVEPSHPSQCPSSPSHSCSPRRAFHPPPATQSRASRCVVDCLWRLASMLGHKSVLKLLNYSTLKTVYADFYRLALMVMSSSYSLSLTPLHPPPKPKPWMVWTSDTMAMFGQRPSPPTLQTT